MGNRRSISQGNIVEGADGIGCHAEIEGIGHETPLPNLAFMSLICPALRGLVTSPFKKMIRLNISGIPGLFFHLLKSVDSCRKLIIGDIDDGNADSIKQQGFQFFIRQVIDLFEQQFGHVADASGIIDHDDRAVCGLFNGMDNILQDSVHDGFSAQLILRYKG